MIPRRTARSLLQAHPARRLVSAAIGVSALCAVTPARSESSESVWVEEVEIQQGSPHRLNELRARIEAGLQEAAQVVAETPSAARWFVHGSVSAQGATYTLDFEVRAAGGRAVHSAIRACPVCTVSEVGDLAQELGSSLGRDIARAQATRRLAAPAATAVTPAPAAAAVTPAPVTTAVTATRPAQRATASSQLSTSDGNDRYRTPRDHRSWALVTAGGAVALWSTGLTLLRLDGRGTCSDSACPRVYSTRTIGWISVAAGTIMTGLSGWHWHKAPRMTPTLDATSDRFTVGLAGRF